MSRILPAPLGYDELLLPRYLSPSSQQAILCQRQLEQDILRRYMFNPPTPFYHYEPQARTNMKDSWTNMLADDIGNNNNRISKLEKTIVDREVPIPEEDLKLMKVELQLRKALQEILQQRRFTDAARSQGH